MFGAFGGDSADFEVILFMVVAPGFDLGGKEEVFECFFVFEDGGSGIEVSVGISECDEGKEREEDECSGGDADEMEGDVAFDRGGQ